MHVDEGGHSQCLRSIFEYLSLTNRIDQFVDFGKGALIHDVFQGSMAEGIFCSKFSRWLRLRLLVRG